MLFTSLRYDYFFAEAIAAADAYAYAGCCSAASFSSSRYFAMAFDADATLRYMLLRF